MTRPTLRFPSTGFVAAILSALTYASIDDPQPVVEEYTRGLGSNGCDSIAIVAHLLPGTLSRQSLLHPALRARLQIKGVALHVFNDLFRLDLALESTQGILQRLTFLQSNLCQINHP